MRQMTTVLIATLLSTASVPALGAWDRIASLDVAAGKTSEVNMEKLEGNVIGLTARQSDVMCDRVAAIYANGDMRPLFRGKLPKGLSVRVDLPPGVIETVTFDCHPVRGKEATIDLAADTRVQAPQSSG
jgi:hypothetical protein